MAPDEFSLLCGFSPSFRMMTLSPLLLCSSKSHKYHYYYKVTYIVLLHLVFPFATKPQALYEIPTPRGISLKGVFQILPPLSGISNDISISKVRVLNIAQPFESLNYKTFSIETIIIL